LSPSRRVRSARSLAVWIVGALALAGMLAPQANAATPFAQVGAFAYGWADGNYNHQQKLAVEHSTDRVFQTDVVNDRIVVWAPNGTGADELTSFGQGELSDPYGVAVDQSSGQVYVSDAGNNRIVRYTSDGASVPTYTRDVAYVGPAQGSGTGEIGSFAAAIAIDPVSTDLLVADPGNDLVQRFDDAGAFVLSIDGSGSPSTFTGPLDLAVDSTGDVIIVDSDGGDPAQGSFSRVERFDATGAWEATLGPVDTAANVAVRPVNDEVVVSGNQDAANYFQPVDPTLTVFDASSSRELTVTGVPQSTISGVAIDNGAAGQMFVATDTSRSGEFPPYQGSVSVQVFDVVVPAAPTIDAEASASDVTATSATLNATIDPNSAETTYRFEYGMTDSYGSSTPDMSAGSGNDPVPVSVPVSDLVPGTTYHVRVVVDNGIGGPVEGADQTFATAPQLAPAVEPPVASATGIGIDAATLNATVNPNYSETTYHFEYGTTTAYGSQTTPASAGADNSPVPVTEALTGLEPSTTYHFRIVADNAIGEPVEGSDQTFTTLDLAPTITVGAATGVGIRTATVHGTVDTHGVAATAVFYIAQTNGPHRQASETMNLAAVDGPQAVSATLSDLPPNGKFTVRLASTTDGSGASATSEPPGEFSTAPLPPYVPTPRPPVDPTPYGCENPRLTSYEGRATPGGRVTLVGSDLGVHGTVAVGGERAEVVDYGSSRIAIELPSELSGKPQVTVDCGKATNAIALTIVKPPSNRVGVKVGGDGALTLRTPGKGRLTVRGAGVRNVAKRANGKTTIRVKLKLTKAARKQLARSKSGRISKRVSIAFRPTGGSARKVTRSVTFKKG
jgi:hypothetical protein